MGNRNLSPDMRNKVFKFEDLVETKPDSIVSRTLVDDDSGTVTVFAFGAGQSLSEHTAPYDAMVTALEGEAEITISGEKHRVRKGETLMMPAREPHALSAPEDFKMVLVMIRTSKTQD
jgi:quercetin dioxygenase-like cupin family protein